jgi:hypothetical protein
MFVSCYYFFSLFWALTKLRRFFVNESNVLGGFSCICVKFSSLNSGLLLFREKMDLVYSFLLSLYTVLCFHFQLPASVHRKISILYLFWFWVLWFCVVGVVLVSWFCCLSLAFFIFIPKCYCLIWDFCIHASMVYLFSFLNDN